MRSTIIAAVTTGIGPDLMEAPKNALRGMSAEHA
jgi:hypothetical protein